MRSSRGSPRPALCHPPPGENRKAPPPGAEPLAFSHGETIFAQGTGPQRAAWVVRRGGVELVDRGRVLDLLPPGEPSGPPSMLAELPTGLEARAHGETTCYRLPADVTRPLLARPEGL